MEKAKLDAKTKKYSTLINDNHKRRMELQETENHLVHYSCWGFEFLSYGIGLFQHVCIDSRGYKCKEN